MSHQQVLVQDNESIQKLSFVSWRSPAWIFVKWGDLQITRMVFSFYSCCTMTWWWHIFGVESSCQVINDRKKCFVCDCTGRYVNTVTAVNLWCCSKGHIEASSAQNMKT